MWGSSTAIAFQYCPESFRARSMTAHQQETTRSYKPFRIRIHAWRPFYPVLISFESFQSSATIPIFFWLLVCSQTQIDPQVVHTWTYSNAITCTRDTWRDSMGMFHRTAKLGVWDINSSIWWMMSSKNRTKSSPHSESVFLPKPMPSMQTMI